MRVGVPTEIKDNENRIAMVPGGAAQLVRAGHEVLVQTDAGLGSGFANEEYTAAGAKLVASAAEIFAAADMILKVKEPQPVEVAMIRKDQLVFTYFHFAAAEELTRGMLKTGAVAIAYETILDKRGRLPLLTPMSEVAGRMAVQVGVNYLQKSYGGRGSTPRCAEPSRTCVDATARAPLRLRATARSPICSARIASSRITPHSTASAARPRSARPPISPPCAGPSPACSSTRSRR
jgi:NAD/NADP transhydrogenase alpha subunit